MECKNCNTIFDGNYCNSCGQITGEKRFILSNLPGEFLHGFYHVHSGLLFTIRELFIRPGETLRGYIYGKRVKYFNPFTYLLLISLVGGFLYKWSGVPEHLNENFLASGDTIRFTGKYFSYRMLLTIPAYAIMCSIIYGSFKYNIAEHLIVNTFLISQSMVLMVVWMLIVILLKPGNLVFEILYISAFSSFILYQVIVFFRLFNNGKTLLRLIKAAATVFIGLGLSFVLMNFLVKIVHL
ncbi:MAG: DUF3667 domain-containing protein [Bacteroidota bacterium]